MKYLLFILPLFTLTMVTAQQPQPKPVELQKTNDQLVWLGWNEGYEKAVKDHKIVLVDAYTDWCGWCKRMDRDTYAQPDVIAKINSRFIPIKFNPEIPEQNYKIGDQVFTNQQLFGLLTQGKSTGFPTIYYIFPQKRSITVDAGYKGPADFLVILGKMIEEDSR